MTAENLRQRAWAAGFRGVAGLAAAIGRSRVSVYRAIRNPSRFGPTHRLIVELLDTKK